MDDDAKRRELELAFAAALLVAFRRMYEANEPTSNAEAMLLPGTLAAALAGAGPILHDWLYKAAKLGIETALLETGVDLFVDVDALARSVADERTSDLLAQLQKTTLARARQAVFKAAEQGLSLAAMYASVSSLFSLARAQAISITEITFSFNVGIERLGGILTGLTGWQWVALEDACPICSALAGIRWVDGKPGQATGKYFAGEVRPFGTPFVHPGGTGAQAAYAGQTFRRPPVHPGCRCRIYLVRGLRVLTFSK